MVNRWLGRLALRRSPKRDATPDGDGSVGSDEPQDSRPDAVKLSVDRFLVARAAAGEDAAAGITEAEAARELVTRCQAADDQAAVADAEDRLLLLTAGGPGPGADGPARAAAARARRAELAVADPARHLPLVGLAGVLHSWLLARAGRTAESTEAAEQAVKVLRGRADAVERVQPALVLAFDALAGAAFADDRLVDAERALEQALVILRQLANRDPRFAGDLAEHESLLSDAGIGPVLGRGLVPYAEGLVRGVALSKAGRHAEAEPLVADAMNAFSIFVTARPEDQPVSFWDRVVLRHAALACWRYTVLAHAGGRLDEAIDAGERAFWLGQQLVRHAQSGSAEHTAALAQLITVLSDLGEYYALAGHQEEQIERLREAILLGDGHTAPEVRRAYGTALHNMSLAMIRRPGASAVRVRPLIDRAVAVREGLAGIDGLAVWELTNSLLIQANIAGYAGDGAAAVRIIARAAGLADGLGPGGASLRDQVGQVKAILSEIVPAAVAAARAAGTWPPDRP
jgi:tetratricopeptide (TPR) repeat protein